MEEDPFEDVADGEIPRATQNVAVSQLFEMHHKPSSPDVSAHVEFKTRFKEETTNQQGPRLISQIPSTLCQNLSPTHIGAAIVSFFL